MEVSTWKMWKKPKGPLLIFNFWSIDASDAAAMVQSLFVGVESQRDEWAICGIFNEILH